MSDGPDDGGANPTSPTDAPAVPGGAGHRLLVVADSDSYVKWGAALASRFPAEWRTELIVLESPVRPSPRQLAAALAGSAFTPDSASTVHLGELPGLLARTRPDAVLLALRGPLVRVVAPIVNRSADRPVIVSGFPGLTIPAAPKAIVYRELVDLIVLHSRREVREFRANAVGLGVAVEFGLATLPFLPETAVTDAAADPARRDLVFAAQAKVPAEREDRVRLLGWLADAARRRPSRRVVVKVRARPGEAQTHAEAFDFAELLADAEVRRELGGSLPPNLVVEDGPMSQHLSSAAGLVTVSSTAVLEAVAAGIPALLVDEFGIDAKLINTVFEGSGLFGGAEALAGWETRHPNPDWLADNYFHGREHDDWARRLALLLERRADAALEPRERSRNLTGGALRRAFERKRMLGKHDRSFAGAVSMLVAVPARWVLRRVRRLRRRVFALRGGVLEV
ncbi:DUF6716 putative glycosyltransferase [Agromyces badenianii]|uniref:DUF6716 putative glycosyltransferase n=1 Tax=Agromyces badenianii TaxID=2080742 RepID=UPI000D599334|nr:DUF6716 putative glycosyltransferase [Agromyces badenianii]PWC04970.1 hypothetical protein DCE94_01180 [Agromyces badenianii]